MDPKRWEVTMPTSFLSETTSEIVREVVSDAPTIFGIGVDTAIGLVTGGGAAAAAFGGWKLLKILLSRGRKQTAAKKEDEGGQRSNAPFPRYLDEARELRELRHTTEGRIPEFDALVGRVVQDEIEASQQNADEQTKTILGQLWLAVRNRVDQIAPISVNQYQDR